MHNHKTFSEVWNGRTVRMVQITDQNWKVPTISWILSFLKLFYAPLEVSPFYVAFIQASIWDIKSKLSQNIRENEGKIVCLRFHWSERSAREAR